jgi:xanthine dehydrogenase/oxidase
VSTIAGNICTASPISDLNPVWVALGAHIRLQSKSSVRLLPMTEFFLGYRKIALKPSEVAVSLFVPFTREHEFASSFKQAKRRDDDIAIVNAAFRVLLDNNLKVKEACLVYGGMGPTTLVSSSASKFLIGKKWDMDLSNIISKHILDDFPLPFSAPGGQVQFRKTLGNFVILRSALSFFHKFLIQTLHELDLVNKTSQITPDVASCIEEIERDISRGEQVILYFLISDL